MKDRPYRRLDLSNQRFGRLTALQINGRNSQHVTWLCRCDCGNSVTATTKHLRSGSVRSCGCLRFSRQAKHGQTGTPEHRSWMAMRARCYNKSAGNYCWYGARGIKVCDEWESFENFLRDMGRKPSANHSIGRIDSNKDYGPDNCRWENITQQNRNRSTSRYVTYKNRRMPLVEAAKELGVRYNTLRERIRRGIPLERALSGKRLSRWEGHK